ncbi:MULTISPECIES: PAS domain-containing sensor histidine kinase [unclassified Mucilaginibacter]|uniref:PAS domain-containing sensor histidine kinase n=1 Tax=unclassified Mucilaginibacter TaxID=2617802 RepID=UPI00095BBDC9|nr:MULTISPECIES: PAS domain-containing sensor histidine kinase [unclassified Mucilaginibacter]OJW12994.1 MAG: hypothetical protein BGO48_14775 [Mucilaginibacter sp. 44-25]PLW90171.1 MAG: hypothetical protein C0154_07795 [Mucilaginibacter sp.]HEK20726.1 PAS domain-containing protein [Bacteroidota bacterium]
MSSEVQQFSGENAAHIAHFADTGVSIWRYNIDTREVWWSTGFYQALGYQKNDIECSYSVFFDYLLYYEDRQKFLKTTLLTSNSVENSAHIRLLTKHKGYQWFQNTTKQYITETGRFIYGILINISEAKTAELKAVENETKFAEIGRIAKMGYWQIDCRTMELELSREIYDIYELNPSLPISVDELLSYFLPQHEPVIKKAIDDALQHCIPYDIELQFKTAKENIIWVKCKGIPVIDEYGRSKYLRGIFQNIDSIKKRGITMQSSINLLDDQNKRLQNFAYIVSHNLRSHAGNLKFMVDLFEETPAEHERAEIFSHIKTISQSLSATMSHLDEIVKMQAEISNGTKLLELADIFTNVISALQADIKMSGAQINTNFSNAPTVNYIPAYLESIFQNLLTNAIKYRHPERTPVINITTYKAGNEVFMAFEDNGMGIDLERYGNQLFGMYKTFHTNPDAKGIGLFMTRNQVEALGGYITVESAVNIGTKFTIKLV